MPTTKTHGGRREGAGRPAVDVKRRTPGTRTPEGAIDILYRLVDRAEQQKQRKVSLYEVMEPLIDATTAESIPSIVVRSTGAPKGFPVRLTEAHCGKLASLAQTTGKSVSAIIDQILQNADVNDGE